MITLITLKQKLQKKKIQAQTKYRFAFNLKFVNKNIPIRDI